MREVSGLEAFEALRKERFPKDVILLRMLNLDLMIASMLGFLKDLALLGEFYIKFPTYKGELEIIRKSVHPGEARK